MASGDAPTTFEAAFKALVNYIQASISKSEILQIPESIVQPFRRASQPTDPTLVRALLKLFDASKQHHTFKLEPRSFAGVVSIVFHFPHSVAQERLLHIFLVSDS